MKHLIKAWKAYRGRLKKSYKDTYSIAGTTGGMISWYFPADIPSFEGFMDYLVSKEKKGKRK